MHFPLSTLVTGAVNNGGNQFFFFESCNPPSKKPEKPAIKKTKTQPAKREIKRAIPPKVKQQKLSPPPPREKKESDIFSPSLPEAKYLGLRVQRFCKSKTRLLKFPDGKTLDHVSSIYYIRSDHEQLKLFLLKAKEKFSQRGGISLYDSQKHRATAEIFREAASMMTPLRNKLWRCYRKKNADVIISKRFELIDRGILYYKFIITLLSDKKIAKRFKINKIRAAWEKFDGIYRMIFNNSSAAQQLLITDTKTLQFLNLYNQTKALLAKRRLIKYQRSRVAPLPKSQR
ncbi:MAG: hypothetical protein ABIE74_01470 [Pseudomonadota bacterium]